MLQTHTPYSLLGLLIAFLLKTALFCFHVGIARFNAIPVILLVFMLKFSYKLSKLFPPGLVICSFSISIAKGALTDDKPPNCLWGVF